MADNMCMYNTLVWVLDITYSVVVPHSCCDALRLCRCGMSNYDVQALLKCVTEAEI